MIHRNTRESKHSKNYQNINNTVRHDNSKIKEISSMQQRRRRRALVLILCSFFIWYFMSVVLLSKNENETSFITMGDSLLSGITVGSGWEVPSPSSGSIGNRLNQTVLLYIDGGITSEEEESAKNSLDSLVNQFGSRSLEWEVVHHPNFGTRRQSLPCIWISKSSEPTKPIDATVSRCIQMAPLVASSSDDPFKTYSLDWKLQKQGMAIGVTNPTANSTFCLAHQAGPRPDFWQRGVTFERVGLWVQSSSIRSHVWNLALLPELSSSESTASLESWLLDTIRKLSTRKASDLTVGRNSSAYVVTSPVDEYKPVPYFRDLLTTVFTVMIWDPEPAVSSSQNLEPRGRKQRQKKKRNQSPGQRRSQFWKKLHEIILTGSIPIVVTVDDMPRTQNDCNQELFFDSASPILRVSNQEGQLSALLETLCNEAPTKWNQRQIELREWYKRLMIQRALNVENWILDTAPSVIAPPFETRNQWAKEYGKYSMPALMQQRKYDPKPLCLTPPFYGRTNNKVIEIGKLLKLSYQEGKHRALALDRRWTNWYRPHFDERPDVLLDYFPHGECEKVFTAREAFEIPDWDLSYLIHLLPRHDYRERAEKILNTWQHGRNYISVHRRDLEGSCRVHARCSDVELETSTCLQERDPSEVCSAELRLRACDMEHDMVPNPDGLPIVLFTDGQVPAKDATFPHMFNTTDFFVEMWLMVNSKTHWGNPRSTVDAVVASWREGRGMEPKECYPS